MMGRGLKFAVAEFSIPLSEREIPLFRGAMLHAAQGDSTLFHDHVGEGFRYRYPLIQYKVINEHAAVVCLDDGVEVMRQFLQDNRSCQVRIGQRMELLRVASGYEDILPMGICESGEEQTYLLHRYLPLNQENYEQYKQMDSLVERYALIERCLLGNILSMAKGLGLFFEQKVKVTLLDVENEHIYRYKKVNMTGFDLKFKTNVLLPGYAGLGKGVSLGFGVITLKG